MTTVARDQDIGMLTRVLVAYSAWLTMIFAEIPPFNSVFIVIAAPMFFGSVIWHLWTTRSLSVVNRMAFCGAVAFFPFLVIQVILKRRL
jgi:hypothetical protein